MSESVAVARPILSGLSIVTIGRLGAAAIGMITQVYLAKVLSAASLGVFYMATSLAAFLGIVATCGLPLVAARFLVRYRHRATADFSGLFVATARRVILPVSLVLTAAAVAIILLWPDLPKGERTVLLIGCLAAPGFALARLSGAAATACRRFQLSYLPDLVARPVLFLFAVMAMGLFAQRVDLTLTVVIFVLLVTAQALFQDGALRRIIAPGTRPRQPVAGRLRFMWLKAALPLTGVILMTSIFADLAILSAGLFLGKADLAVFGVCVKIALIAGFVQVTAHKMLQPDLAEALIARDRRRLSHTIAQANLIGVGVGLAAFLAVAATGDLVLSAFGDHFVAGRNILLALLFGQTLIAAGGPAIQVLTLARGQAAAALASILAALCLLATNAVFVPLLGLGGAALAMVCTQIVWAALLAIQVRRTTGIASDIFSLIGLPRRELPISVAS
ncbi:MAG: hypothetical protein WD036_08725 [Bauldia sp.]